VVETSFVTGRRAGRPVRDGGWSVGAGVLRGPSAPLPPDQRLFDFVS
jgi:hypothetical protein